MKNGAVVVSADFGTAKEYGDMLIKDHLAEIFAKDNQISITEVEGVMEYPEDWVESDYTSDATGAQKAATSYLGKVQSTLDALKSDATLTEKVTALQKLNEEAVKAMDEAYAKDVKAAKEAAVKALTALDNSFASNKNFTAADRASIVTEANTAIEGATTIQDLAGIVNAAIGSDTEAIGKYNKLYNRKKLAFADIDGALKGIADDCFNGTDPTALEELKTQLKAYNVEIGTLPTDVASEWYTKISAAKELSIYAAKPETGSTETYKKGQVVMGYEGAKAVKESYQGVKDKLVEAIKKTYYTEIEASKVLGSDGINTFKGVVNSSINTWLVTNDKDGTKISILAYLSADADFDGTGSGTADGLIHYIEAQIEMQINAVSGYSGFGAERKVTASASAKAELDGYLDAVLADKEYDSLLLKTVKVGTTDTEMFLTKAGKTGAQIANPFYAAATAYPTGDDNEGYSHGTITKVECTATTPVELYDGEGTANDVTINGFSDSYDVNDYYDTIVVKKADGTIDDTKAWGKFIKNASVAQIKAGVSGLKAQFNSIYQQAVAKYSEKQRATIDATNFTSTNYVSIATVQGFYDSLLPQNSTNTDVDFTKTNFGNVSTAISTVLGLKDQIDTIDSELLSWKNIDVYFDRTFVLSNDGTGKDVYNSVLDASDSNSIISKVLAGDYASVDEVKKAMKDLDTLYSAGVDKYLADAKDSLKEIYNNFIANGNGTNDPSLEDVNLYKQVYKEVLGLLDYDATASDYSGILKDAGDYFKSFTGMNDYTAVRLWFEFAKQCLTLTYASSKYSRIDLDTTFDSTMSGEEAAMLLIGHEAKYYTLGAATLKACKEAVTPVTLSLSGKGTLKSIDGKYYTLTIKAADVGTSTISAKIGDGTVDVDSSAALEVATGVLGTSATVSGMVITTTATGVTEIKFTEPAGASYNYSSVKILVIVE